MDDKSAPVTWQKEVSLKNHSKLAYINKLAKEAGADDLPFEWVKPLLEDNGERFFSEYLKQRKEIQEQYTKHPDDDQCPCSKCGLQPPRVAADIN